MHLTQQHCSRNASKHGSMDMQMSWLMGRDEMPELKRPHCRGTVHTAECMACQVQASACLADNKRPFTASWQLLSDGCVANFAGSIAWC
jgi:hypothetical protein